MNKKMKFKLFLYKTILILKAITPLIKFKKDEIDGKVKDYTNKLYIKKHEKNKS